MIFGREPALFIGLLQALLALVIGIGLHVTPEQQALIMAFAIAATSFITRANVYSEATVQKMKAAMQGAARTTVQIESTPDELAEG